jgi:hypothetical protein
MSFETYGVDLLQLEEWPDREINQEIGYSPRCLITGRSALVNGRLASRSVNHKNFFLP